MTTTEKRDLIDASVSGLETKLASAKLDQPIKRRMLALTDLPPSVRNTIYKYALDTELVNTGLSNVSYTHTLSTEGILQFRASRPPFPVNTSLFYVNKEISKDARQYFYSKNLFVRLEIYTADARHAETLLQDSGVLYTTTSPALLDASKQHALELVLVEKNSSQKRAAVMFPAQYLPRLINEIDQESRATATWAPGHALFVNVVNSYDYAVSRLQGDLLELFRLLSNLGNVTVDSKNLLPRYAEGLQRDMTASSFSAEGWLKSVTELADLADEARDKDDFKLAHEYGQAVIISLTYGFLTHSEALHSQEESFTKNVQRLRWRAELGLGITLSLQHQPITADQGWLSTSNPTIEVKKAAAALLLAETSLSKALSLSTDSPSPTNNPWFLSLPVELIPNNKPTYFTDQERAQTWYVLGTVHTALGEYIFGAGDLERAMGLWGAEGKERVEKAFEKARGGIDGDAENMWVGRIRPGTGLKRAALLAKESETR